MRKFARMALIAAGIAAIAACGAAGGAAITRSPQADIQQPPVLPIAVAERADVWNLDNAFPRWVKGTDLRSDGRVAAHATIAASKCDSSGTYGVRVEVSRSRPGYMAVGLTPGRAGDPFYPEPPPGQRTTTSRVGSVTGSAWLDSPTRPLSTQVWTVQVLTPTSRMSWIVSTPGCPQP